MAERNNKVQTPLSSHEFQAEAMSVQDALIVLAIRLMGDTLRKNPPARQHIFALARSTPLFMMEDYKVTEGRINRFVNWAGTPAMDELFAHALKKLGGPYRRDALEWAAANAVAQQYTDEMNAMLHHIGKALSFTATEVEVGLRQARDLSTADNETPD